MRTLIFSLFVVLFAAPSCKKAMEVKEDKYYEQTNWVRTVSQPSPQDFEMGSGPMHLELRKDGRAFIYPGSGDIVGDGTYKIAGSRLKVVISSFAHTYEFIIQSPGRLKGPNGEILELKTR